MTTTAAQFLFIQCIDPVTALHFFSISFSSYYLCPLYIHLSPLYQLPGHLQPSKTLEVVIFNTYHKLFSAKCAIRTVQWNYIGHHIALFVLPSEFLTRHKNLKTVQNLQSINQSSIINQSINQSIV